MERKEYNWKVKKQKDNKSTKRKNDHISTGFRREITVNSWYGTVNSGGGDTELERKKQNSEWLVTIN